MTAPAKKTTVLRALVRATERAWRAMQRHERECPLCVDQGYGKEERHYERCEVGRLLLRCWIALRDHQDEPSRWTVVEVIFRPGLEP